MDVQDTALVDGGGFKTQKNHDVQLSGHSDKSLSNGNNGFQVSKRIGCQAQKMVSEKRRFSPRLTEIPESKRPYYGTSRKKSQQCPIDKICKGNDSGDCSKKISASYVGVKSEGHTYYDYRQKCSTGGDEVSKSDSTILDADTSSPSSYEGGNNVFFDSQADDVKWLVSSTNADGKSAYAKVKETLRIYNTFYLQAVQVITVFDIFWLKYMHVILLQLLHSDIPIAFSLFSVRYVHLQFYGN